MERRDRELIGNIDYEQKESLEDKFHNHLDICEQCNNNPSNLCEIGKQLINRIGNTFTI